MNPKVVQHISDSDVKQFFQAEKRPGVPTCPLPNAARLFGLRGPAI